MPLNSVVYPANDLCNEAILLANSIEELCSLISLIGHNNFNFLSLRFLRDGSCCGRIFLIVTRNEDSTRIIGEDGVDASCEFPVVWINSRYNYCDIAKMGELAELGLGLDE